MLEESLYCKVYIDTEMNLEQLTSTLNNWVGKYTKMNTVIGHLYEIDILENEDFDPINKKIFPDGFLYFSYYLDIFPSTQSIILEKYILELGLLMKNLWANKISAVAACDYEDKLPEAGGYKSKNVPWPTE